MKNESGSPRIRAVSASMKPPLIRPEGFSQLGDGLQRSSVLRFTMSHSLSVVSRETNRDWNPKHGAAAIRHGDNDDDNATERKKKKKSMKR